jgi:hypothetical protein
MVAYLELPCNKKILQNEAIKFHGLIKPALNVLELHVLMFIYISRTWFFSYLFVLAYLHSLLQVANISGMAIVTLSIDSNSIISRQGTLVAQVAPVTFLYGKIYTSFQVLQRENKSSLGGIKIQIQSSFTQLFEYRNF